MYLKEFRKKLEISQKDFAEKLGIAPSALARCQVSPRCTIPFKAIA